jgi:YegS/Rv2252/BmrU family lipid kinase
VGGDGTLNEVINGLMEEKERRQIDVCLGYIPLGTGCDLARHLSIPVGLEENLTLTLIANSQGRWMDLGKATFRDHAGNPRVRYFHNMVSLGLGGEVVERVNRTSKRFGGFLSFIWATLVTVFLYRPKKIFLQLDDTPEQGIRVWNVAVANGPYHGGGMWEAPGADVSDGKFQITIIGDLHLAQVFYHFPKLYTGKIYETPKTEKGIATRVAASSPQDLLLDMDGEQPGRLPVVLEIIPDAVRIISPVPSAL